jgi:tubulin polyglutamylase TTLL5
VNNETTFILSSDINNTQQYSKVSRDNFTSNYYVQFQPIDKDAIEKKEKQKLINQSRMMATEMAFASQDSNFIRNTTSESSSRVKRLDNIYSDITYNFSNGNQHVDSCTCEKCRKIGKKIHSRNSIIKRLNSNRKKMTTKEIYVGISSKKVDDKSNIFGTYKMVGNVKLVADLLECHNFEKTKNSDFSLLWANHYIKGYCFKSLSRWQRVNLFPRSWECTRKDAMSRNINTMAHLHGQKHFSFMPECYILPQERDSLLHAFESSCGRPWIIKPAGSSQGRGIYITSNILELPDTNQVTKNNDNWIVERYIDKPLLVDNRKFDLRLYVAVTSFNPLKIYLHEEGLARLATEKYSNETYNQKFSHLTNYSINKHNIKNKRSENSNESDSMKGNELQGNELKLSFAELNKILKDMGINTNPIWNKIEDLIVKTLISVESKIYSALEIFSVNNESCFELFGFDVLIDSDLNPWLMEVNFAPSLNTDSPLDLKVKSKVLSDLFNLIGVKQTAGGGTSINANTLLFSNPLSDVLTDEIIDNLKSFDIDLQGDKGKRALSIFIKEMQRATIGGYKLLFPVLIVGEGKQISNILKYNNFFEEERALNKLLAQYILATSLIQKHNNEELNTPDKEESSKKSYTTSRLREHIVNSKEFNSLWGRACGKSVKG